MATKLKYASKLPTTVQYWNRGYRKVYINENKVGEYFAKIRSDLYNIEKVNNQIDRFIHNSRAIGGNTLIRNLDRIAYARWLYSQQRRWSLMKGLANSISEYLKQTKRLNQKISKKAKKMLKNLRSNLRSGLKRSSYERRILKQRITSFKTSNRKK